MSDDAPGDFDPCECVWSHELATRNLINMLRRSQDHCTDNECFGEGPSASNDGATAMFFVGFWLLLALFLMFLRPKTRAPATKSVGDNSGPHYDPPAPALS